MRSSVATLERYATENGRVGYEVRQRFDLPEVFPVDHPAEDLQLVDRVRESGVPYTRQAASSPRACW